MHNRFQAKTLATLAALTLAGTALTACSTESEDAAEGSGIIATTGVWADVAAAVTGEDVDAIITGDAVDPHHFEPSAKDLSRIKEAATVVANGGAYDAALYTVAEQDRIVHAIPLLDHAEHDHEHAHSDHLPESLDELEHAWFAPSKVREVADAVAQRTGGDAGVVDTRIAAIEEKLASVPHVHIGMTEPIAAGLVWGTELHDITPEEYVKASLNHQEPSAAAVSAFLNQIKQGDLDMLFVNPQSTNSATERLAAVAQMKNVPIVEIRETPPAGENFLDYFEKIVDQIVEIANNAEPSFHHH